MRSPALPALLALLPLLPALAGCAAPPGDPPAAADVDEGLPPGPLQVLEVRLEREEGWLGDPALFHLRVAAPPDRRGHGDFVVLRDGEPVTSGSVTLQAGGRENLTFEATLDRPGLHAYTLANHTFALRARVPLGPPPPDLAGPGLPVEKATPLLPDYAPRGYLAYDPANFTVFHRDLHGTNVTLAVHRSVAEAGRVGGHEVVPPEELADFVARTFERAWHVVGGFPFDRTTWVVAGLDDPCRFVGTVQGGARACAADFASGLRPHGPPHAATRPMYREWFGHELFHLWNGMSLVPAASPNGTVQGPESWFIEGVTVYYAARFSAEEDSLDAYRAQLATRWRTYQDLQPRLGNHTFAQLAEASGPPPGPEQPAPAFGDEAHLVYARGALVAHRLDEVLAERGASLDDVLRRLYVATALPVQRFSNADLRGAAVAVGGPDLHAFFDDHVEGTVPLDEPRTWVDHVHHRVVPDGR